MKNTALAGKPKSFFFQNCRRSSGNIGQHVPDRKLSQEGTDLSDDNTSNTVTIPTHADAHIACSSWSGFQSYRHPKHGSLFITVLTSVLLEHAKTKNMTDMLQMVNEVLAEFHDEECKMQMSCFTSSLRQAVWIDSDQTSGQVIPSLNSETSIQKSTPVIELSSYIINIRTNYSGGYKKRQMH